MANSLDYIDAYQTPEVLAYREHQLIEEAKQKAIYEAAYGQEERFYYLATTYTKYPHGRIAAYYSAAKMLGFLEENGLFVYSPIVHSHEASHYVSPELKESYDFWLTIDFKFVKLSRGLIVCMMDGWKESYGITKEIEYANHLRLPIYYTEFMEFPKELV